MRSPAFPHEGDTVAAISTPYGVGGIGIVRMSGAAAESILRKIFHGNRRRTQFISHRLYYGHIINPEDGTLVDEVLVTVMRAPETYTREDMVEIQCHGGHIPVRRILELLLLEGVRLAEPGEFTRRAFMNGRIDLVQAEAVVDAVEAKSATALRFAQRQLDGSLSREIVACRDAVRDMLVEIEAWLDFPEDDLPVPDLTRIRSKMEEVIRAIRALADTYQKGHLFRDGVSLVIGGAPNVGKSTLLNALAGRDRAIVSEAPGTTRDFLEESVLLEGIPVRLVDTAGLRDVEEEVEAKGVAIARRQIEAADLFLCVLDLSSMDQESLDRIHGIAPEGRTLLVLNKMDLVDNTTLPLVSQRLKPLPSVPVSARHGEGMIQLREKILAELAKEGMDLDSRAVVTNLRHWQALEQCLKALERARHQVSPSEPLGDLLASDLRHALRGLGEILGETTSEEILQRIFDSFCVGK